jgi:NADH:ubiquinone oxidoreductase subunit F (NADH-binding)/NAD-dependent dihydropyrimidine dehydrogenase PreA subunit
MLIAAYAIGAQEGYIYVRAEYPIAVTHVKKAAADARAAGLLGRGILGTNFNFDVKIKEGAGAFVCGEETALIASIEGRRGMPRTRPPFPAVSGLWGKPTNINNVESYANVAPIIHRGADWYAGLGTEKSKGTKIFALAGKINNTGLVEVPMGITLERIIFDIGGGIPGGKSFKAAQTGGPSGGCIPASLVNLPIDYDSLTAAGAIMGSGGLVIMDENTCMVDLAKYFLTFTKDESCGKCVPCRVGTKRMLEMLQRITEGKGKMEDLGIMKDLAFTIRDASLCGLGQTAPNPVLTTLNYFYDEYRAHIEEKRCPAGVCKALIHYSVDASACKGCGVCRKACPQGAVTGEAKAAHVIDPALCIKCGICYNECKFNAIKVS